MLSATSSTESRIRSKLPTGLSGQTVKDRELQHTSHEPNDFLICPASADHLCYKIGCSKASATFISKEVNARYFETFSKPMTRPPASSGPPIPSKSDPTLDISRSSKNVLTWTHRYRHDSFHTSSPDNLSGLQRSPR